MIKGKNYQLMHPLNQPALLSPGNLSQDKKRQTVCVSKDLDRQSNLPSKQMYVCMCVRMGEGQRKCCPTSCICYATGRSESLESCSSLLTTVGAGKLSYHCVVSENTGRNYESSVDCGR